MAAEEKKEGFRFWRFARRLTLALLLVCAAVIVFLHLIGVPGWLVEEFIPVTKGVTIKVGSANLENWTTVHLKHLILSSTNGPGTHLTSSSLKLGLEKYSDGKYWTLFSIPQSASVSFGNSPETEANLLLTDAKLDGRILWEDKTIKLNNLAIRWHGLEIAVRGAFENSLSVTNWDIFRRPKVRTGKKMDWNKFLEQLNQVEFSPGSRATLTFSGDGAAQSNVTARLDVRSAEVHSPFGNVRQFIGSALLTNLAYGESAQLGNFAFHAATVQSDKLIANGLTSRGKIAAGQKSNDFEINFSTTLQTMFVSQLSSTNVSADTRLYFNGESGTAELGTTLKSSYFQFPGQLRGQDFALALQAELTNGHAQFFSMRAEASNLSGIGKAWKVPTANVEVQSIGSPLFPLELTLQAQNIETDSGSATRADVFTTIHTNSIQRYIADLGLWTNAVPYNARFRFKLEGVKSPQVNVTSLAGEGTWKSPFLELDQYHGRIGDGSISGKVELDVDSRQVEVTSSSDFDPFAALPLLPKYGQRWLQQFTWEKPPKIKGLLGLILPAWTNTTPNWAKEVLPTLSISGDFTSGPGAFRKVPVSSASGSFSYTNLTWHIPTLHAIRPEGRLLMKYQGNNHIGNYYFDVDSYFDPKVIRPVLVREQQKVLDECDFTSPPHVKGEVFGKWGKYDQIKFFGTAAATNLSFRNVKIDTLNASTYYTNFSLFLTNLSLTQSNRSLLLLEGGIDFKHGTGYVARATNNMDPYPLARAIHPVAYDAIKPYQFASPPNVIVSGTFGFGSIEKVNFDFNINGGDFAWDKIKADQVAGNLVWRGRSLMITNVKATAYKSGLIAGAASFLFPKETNGSTFEFDFSYKDVDLQSLINVWTGNTNHLEGVIEGQIIITNALSADFKSWNGHGWSKLTDGLIWEIPIFGIFSPLFDALVPGLGKSKAREGSATFVITNSIVYSDDLEIRSPAMRMQYSGTCDFDQNINAIVEAEIFRDTWAVGRALSWVLSPFTKLLKFEVTGKLGDPEAEPLHIPRAVMFALRPFKSIKDLISGPKPNPGASEKPPH